MLRKVVLSLLAFAVIDLRSSREEDDEDDEYDADLMIVVDLGREGGGRSENPREPSARGVKAGNPSSSSKACSIEEMRDVRFGIGGGSTPNF